MGNCCQVKTEKIIPYIEIPEAHPNNDDQLRINIHGLTVVYGDSNEEDVS